MAGAELRVLANTIQHAPMIGRWFAAAALACVGLAAAVHTGRALWSTVSVLSAPPAAEVDAHCKKFIELARARFGALWKTRLDPRDTLCAAQVQEAWEHTRYPRVTAADAISLTPPPPKQVAPLAKRRVSERTTDPHTYCLNLVSRARWRYGPMWRFQLGPEAAGCEWLINRMY